MYIKKSTGYYQKNKEMLQKDTCKKYLNLSEEEKKSVSIILNAIKIFVKMKNKGYQKFRLKILMTVGQLKKYITFPCWV